MSLFDQFAKLNFLPEFAKEKKISLIKGWKWQEIGSFLFRPWQFSSRSCPTIVIFKEKVPRWREKEERCRERERKKDLQKSCWLQNYLAAGPEKRTPSLFIFSHSFPETWKGTILPRHCWYSGEGIIYFTLKASIFPRAIPQFPGKLLCRRKPFLDSYVSPAFLKRKIIAIFNFS